MRFRVYDKQEKKYVKGLFIDENGNIYTLRRIDFDIKASGELDPDRYVVEFSTGHNDSGNACRFFKSIIYTAKADKTERSEYSKVKNNHPTVKPVELMEYLINMVTPKKGIVLDPFMGSGTTGVASKNLSREFIGIELDPEYFKIAESRINNTISQVRLDDII